MNSFLQTSEWADFQRSIGRNVFEIAGANVIQHDITFGRNYLYIPYGPELVSHQFAGELSQLALRQGSIFAKAEPTQDDIAKQLVSLGFCRSEKTIQPHKTVVIDLDISEEELLSGMHHKTRYNIRVAERHGIVVLKIQNQNNKIQIEAFWNLMQKTSARDKFNSYPKEYYEKLLDFTSLWFAYYENKPIAAAMILVHGDTAYYLHGASDHDFRALMAPYALHWNVMRNIKYQISNIKNYDFWGIDPNRWPGVTRFKLGWGGRVVEYPGAFDLTISRPWKLAYDLAQKLKSYDIYNEFASNA